MNIKIAPSILSADFAHLHDEIQKVIQGGADWIHVDVMDGHFVPNLTIGACVVASIKKICPIPLDVHLMITDPQKYIQDFAKAGSDLITFHQEAIAQPKILADEIHKLGMKAGISIRPHTPIHTIAPFLKYLDLVLIMSVEPGFGGQTFQPQALEKATQLRQHPDCPPDISIDGGINLETAPLAVHAGVNILVAGSTIFHAPDATHKVKQLRQAACVQ